MSTAIRERKGETMSRNTKEKAAAREIQARTGCSYSTALMQVRAAEELRKAQVSLATEHMTPLAVVVAGVTDPSKEGEK